MAAFVVKTLSERTANGSCRTEIARPKGTAVVSTNLHIWQWKIVFLHALHVHFSSFDILKTSSFFLWRDMTFYCSCADKCSNLACPKRWFQFNSRIDSKAHFSGIITLSNWKMIAETRSDIFRSHSRFCRRRVWLSSLPILPYERPTGPGLTWQTTWLAIEGRQVWSRHYGSLFPINIQYPQFFSVVQSPIDNWQSSFSPTTFLEIAVCSVWCLVNYHINREKLFFPCVPQSTRFLLLLVQTWTKALLEQCKENS